MMKTRVHTTQIVEFRKNIKADHLNVQDFRVEFAPPGFFLSYTTNKPLSQKEALEILYKTKELYFSDRFQKEVVVDRYYKYYRNDGTLPNIFIVIGFPGNGEEKSTNYAFNAYGWDHYQNWGFQYWVQGKLVQSGKVP